jgi:Mg2+ and Co2+ transporter CorA
LPPPLVPPNWQLPDYFRGRLGTSVGRQRLMQHEGQLLIVAHRVPASGENSRRGVLFWLDANHEWHASSGDPGRSAIQMLIDDYEKAIEKFNQQEEKAALAQEYLPLLDGLAPIMRSTRNLYDVLQEARKAAPERRELIDLRDRAYEASRNAELLFQDAKNSMDVAVVRRAEEQAIASHKMGVAAHRLNTMAAIFFPLATLGTIFGTTFTENWSWSGSTLPFLLFLVSGLLAGIFLAIFVNRSI